MMKVRLGARFPAGALHDPPARQSTRRGSGRYPGSHLKSIAFPGKLISQCRKSAYRSPVTCVMNRLALTVAGAAQALRAIAHLFPV